ncbi:hypothetical protein [Parapedomonas caeni]
MARPCQVSHWEHVDGAIASRIDFPVKKNSFSLIDKIAAAMQHQAIESNAASERAMCGIVGLFLRNPGLEPELGAMLSVMLATMSDRGPDSAGFAVYGEGDAGRVKLTLRDPEASDFPALAAELDRPPRTGPI